MSLSVYCVQLLVYLTHLVSFFGAYHCILQSAKFLNPTPNATEMNVGIASVSTLAPLVTLPKLRPLLPYAVMLIVLDVINGMGTF